MSIAISMRSQELTNKFLTIYGLDADAVPAIKSADDIVLFFEWLDKQSVLPNAKSKKDPKAIEFVRMSLATELLHDLNLSFEEKESRAPDPKEHKSIGTQLKLALLVAAGVLVAACEGFDSVVTMISVFSLPSVVILGIGILFSSLSVFAFCGLNLVQMANSMGVRIGDAPKLLDVYVRQLHEIKQIRKKISDYDLSLLSFSELKRLQLMSELLQKRYADVAEASKKFQKILDSNRLYLTKLVVTCIAASIFFGGGFCAGQTVSLYFCGLLMTAVTPASLPVILFSTLVGLAAFGLYWCVETQGITTFVSSWFGLDEEKISVICDKEALLREGAKLTNINKKLISAIEREEKEHYNFEKEGETYNGMNADEKTSSMPQATTKPTKAGHNIYRFMSSSMPTTSSSDEPNLERNGNVHASI
jgi:hypothetical protein